MSDLFAPGDSLAAARDIALQHLCGWMDAKANAITGLYPEAEMRSWPQQEAAAQAISTGTASADETAFLNGLKGGDPLASFAAKVTTKAQQFRAIVQVIKATRSNAEAAIAAAPTMGAVYTAVSKAQAQFTAALAALAP